MGIRSSWTLHPLLPRLGISSSCLATGSVAAWRMASSTAGEVQGTVKGARKSVYSIYIPALTRCLEI